MMAGVGRIDPGWKSMIVFLTTHFLEEAGRLGDRIAILVKGSIVTLDSVARLKVQAQESPVVEVWLRDASGQVQEQGNRSLERLLLALLRLAVLLAGKLLSGMTFGLAVTLVVLLISLAIFGAAGINCLMRLLAMLLPAIAFSGLGAIVSVEMGEVFEAQSLANFIRFPMMFLGGVFVPVVPMPAWLQVIARLLPLTYSVDILRVAWSGGSWATAVIGLVVRAAFSL